MLIDEIVDFCNAGYQENAGNCNCDGCGNRCKRSGKCKDCLEEIHYPTKYPQGKKDYDCSNLVNFYMCDYTFKYASEMLYLIRQSDALKKLKYYHILSIGCGGCPDLMAFETYLQEEKETKALKYYGLDKNPLWKPVHDEIVRYSDNNNISAKFRYVDAIDHCKRYKIRYANVIVIQYLISHLYNTKQIDKLQSFYDDLIQNIIAHRDKKKPLVILINDVNRNNRGRDYFVDLCKKLKEAGLHGVYQQYYFDYRIQNEHQRYGVRHSSNNVLYSIPNCVTSYEPWRVCSSAQLLIEVE